MSFNTHNQGTNASTAASSQSPQADATSGIQPEQLRPSDVSWFDRFVRIVGKSFGVLLLLAAQATFVIYVAWKAITWGHPGFKDDYLSVFDAFDFLDIVIATGIILPIGTIIDAYVLMKRFRLALRISLLIAVAVGWAFASTWLLSVFHPFRNIQF